jgi:hypothetical protein
VGQRNTKHSPKIAATEQENTMRHTFSRTVSIIAMLALLTAAAVAGNKKGCQPVGGMLLTDLGAIDQYTTMGPATGDLKGAVSATIQNVDSPDATTLVFTVQHHWVTDSGDTLQFQPAKATVKQVAPNSTLYGVSSYSAHLSGGTGKFAGASGDLNFIGEADLSTGALVFRYTGTVCVSDKD